MIVISEKQIENYNAGPKAPRDINVILRSKMNCSCIEIPIKKNKNKFSKIKNILLKNIYLSNLKKTSEYYLIQMPFSRSNYLKKFVKKNNTILLVHDLVGLRYKRKYVEKREISIYKRANFIVVHNEKMKQYLTDKGIEESKIFKLELFDYICKNDNEKKLVDFDKKPIIIYAGNLVKEKSPFLHQINQEKINYKFNLYGVGITHDINKKIKYMGSYQSDELPGRLQGDLGLVWDGNLDESDENIGFKNYTKYNNPHKLSCYIAAGLPVIVWRKAAIADFVKKYNIGYTISNIYDINNIDFSDYKEKLKNVQGLSEKVKNGYFTKKVIKEIFNDIGVNENEI